VNYRKIQVGVEHTIAESKFVRRSSSEKLAFPKGK